jgi:hypothetical protein
MDGHVAKPIQAAQLFATIDAVLGAERASNDEPLIARPAPQ